MNYFSWLIVSSFLIIGYNDFLGCSAQLSRVGVHFGQTVRLFCNKSMSNFNNGNSPIALQWERLNGDQVAEGEILILNDIKPSDLGIYLCKATIHLSEGVSEIIASQIEVFQKDLGLDTDALVPLSLIEEKPELLFTPEMGTSSNRDVELGSNLYHTCQARFKSRQNRVDQFSYHWMGPENQRLGSNNYIYIPNIQSTHAGVYTCVALHKSTNQKYRKQFRLIVGGNRGRGELDVDDSSTEERSNRNEENYPTRDEFSNPYPGRDVNTDEPIDNNYPARNQYDRQNENSRDDQERRGDQDSRYPDRDQYDRYSNRGRNDENNNRNPGSEEYDRNAYNPPLRTDPSRDPYDPNSRQNPNEDQYNRYPDSSRNRGERTNPTDRDQYNSYPDRERDREGNTVSYDRDQYNRYPDRDRSREDNSNSPDRNINERYPDQERNREDSTDPSGRDQYNRYPDRERNREENPDTSNRNQYNRDRGRDDSTDSTERDQYNRYPDRDRGRVDDSDSRDRDQYNLYNPPSNQDTGRQDYNNYGKIDLKIVTDPPKPVLYQSYSLECMTEPQIPEARFSWQVENEVVSYGARYVIPQFTNEDFNKKIECKVEIGGAGGEIKLASPNMQDTSSSASSPSERSIKLQVNAVRVTAELGDYKEFLCEIYSPTGRYEWLLNNQPLSEDQITNSRYSSTLIIRNIQRQHDGLYECRGGDQTRRLRLSVTSGSPIIRENIKVVVSPANVRIQPNRIIKIECTMENEFNRLVQGSANRLRWRFRDGSSLNRDSRFYIAPSNIGGSSLTINQIQSNDSPLYVECYDSQSGNSASATIIVEGSSNLEPDFGKECDPIDIKCEEYNGRSPIKSTYSASWKCDGEDDCGNRFDEKDCQGSFGCSGTQYQCQRNNLTIPAAFVCDGEMDCPQSDDEQGCSSPVITVQPGFSSGLRRGDRLRISCTATGKPLPKVVWRFNWRCLPNASRFRESSLNQGCSSVTSTLELDSVQSSDAGIYNCEALSNKGRTISAESQISVN